MLLATGWSHRGGTSQAGLRPRCEACSGVTGRDTIDIAHPAGEELLCGIPHSSSYGALGNMRRR